MSIEITHAERAALREEVDVAARLLPPTWPLETFIAVNPLGGLEDRPFEDAIVTAADVLGARGTLPEPAFREAFAEGRIGEADLVAALGRRHAAVVASDPVPLAGRTVTAAEALVCDLLHGAPAAPPRRRVRTLAERRAPDRAAAVDGALVKWCAAFLDRGQAAWRMPGHERGFYAAWRALAPRDRSLPRAARAALDGLPERPEDAILDALERLGVPHDDRREILEAHLTALPGWSSHVRWRGAHGERIDLVDLLALRLACEAALLTEVAVADDAVHEDVETPDPSAADRAAVVAASLGATTAAAEELEALASLLARVPVGDRALVWLEAYESAYRDPLLTTLAAHRSAPAGERPLAQVVCCIDARSEGLRRHLEEIGPYETLGFAGFFAVAIRYQDLLGGAPSALCPVLLEPAHDVREEPVDGVEGLAARHLVGQRAMRGAEDSFHAAKDDLIAPFALAEVSGWAAGPLAAAKTLFAGPYGALRDRLHDRAAPPVPTVLDVQRAFTLQERVVFAEVALRTMGLTRGFGRFVVLCGHEGRTENNPYESALHCGACGGQGGGPNARTAAAILNGADVRHALAARGIVVPEDTWFVAARHETVSDEVTLLDHHLVRDSHRSDLDRLGADLREAGGRLSAERAGVLPGAPRDLRPAEASRHVRTRGADWAQVFPEWGLAGNAAFIVGPRSLTRGVDLGRRCFLHSYDAAVDEDGSALETILTAPLVVAQWINCQYYFSTVDPVVHGAGTKTIHNVVGGIGVLAGPDGDLQVGLPWQSVADGRRLVHEPVRLLAVVEAPLERIDAIIDAHPALENLVVNDWIALAARESSGERWERWTRWGWEAWHEEEVLAR